MLPRAVHWRWRPVGVEFPHEQGTSAPRYAGETAVLAVSGATPRRAVAVEGKSMVTLSEACWGTEGVLRLGKGGEPRRWPAPSWAEGLDPGRPRGRGKSDVLVA